MYSKSLLYDNIKENIPFANIILESISKNDLKLNTIRVKKLKHYVSNFYV